MISKRKNERGPKARKKCKHGHQKQCQTNEEDVKDDQYKLAYQIINEDLARQSRDEDERLRHVTITETITDPDETNQKSLSGRSESD